MKPMVYQRRISFYATVNKGDFLKDNTKNIRYWVIPVEKIDFNIIDNDKNEEIFNEDKVDIMGTFQTIRFKNESDKSMGLEVLVSDNFYNLFTHFQEENSILISDNRKFKTSSIKNSNNDRVLGV